jgi:hypothetical protein
LNDAFVINQPIQKVGGDGYWVYKKDHFVFIALFSCVGEGHLASMMARIYANALKKLVIDYKIEFTGSILQFIHREIQARFKDKKNMILNTGADLGIIKIDLNEKIMDFAGARMDLLKVQEGKIEIIRGDELQIGELFEHKHEYNTVKIDTSVPAKYYLMSDGLKRLKGGATLKPLGIDHLTNFFVKNRGKSLKDQKALMLELITDWKGSFDQSEDLSLLGFEL